MPVESQVFGTSIINLGSLGLVSAVINSLIIALFILYFIFSLVIVRQVNLMTETLITEVAPALRAFSIIHSGFALGVIILFIGLLFG